MKLSRNLKILIFLVISTSFIYYSECLESSNSLLNQLQNKVQSENSNHYGNSNSNSVSSSNTNTEKIFLNTGIFMNSGNLKHRKIRAESLNENQNYVKNMNSYSLLEKNSKNKFNSNVQKKNKKRDDIGLDKDSDFAKSNNLVESAYAANKEKYNDLSKKKIDLSKSGPILMHSWIKYFKYNDDFSEDNKNNLKILGPSPKKFYVNSDFKEQMKYFPGQDYSQIDKDGENRFVKSEEYFYLVLYKNIVTIFSTKGENVRNAKESFTISDMRPVYEDDRKIGGITNFGDFSEGSCTKVITRDTNKIVWIICFDKMSVKNNFTELLRTLKINEQHDDGIIALKHNNKNANKKDTLQNILNPNGRDPITGQTKLNDENGNLGVSFNSTQKLTDGYWIVLQDWTQCSLKCGGGTSTLQRMCVPPKNGGAECIGQSIVTRPCNMQPCPDVLKTAQKNLNNTKYNKPILKIMPLSDKPQRYVKCKIKEGDLMLNLNVTDPMFTKNPLFTKQQLDGQNSISLPMRVIMNNSTFTLYSGDNTESLYISFNLAISQFYRSTHQGCFEIYESKNKYATLCPFGCDNPDKAVEEWDYDFNLFKHQCSYKRPNLEDEEMKRKLDEKMKEAKQGLLLEQQEKIRTRIERQEKENVDTLIKQTNGVALQAIQKEINLEDLIQKEEMERIEREKAEIRISIEKEKQKKECVMKAIKERELENQYNLNAQKAKETIESIKRETAQQVMIKRSQLQKKIRKIRENAEREKNKLKQQLQTVRMSIADEIGNRYKKGDTNKCILAMDNTKKRNDYCVATFPEDFNDLNYCKSTSEFCTFCCESEFSEFFLEDRKDCYSKTCTRPEPQQEVENGGKWMWHENMK